jgi:predicted CXXCH cytochrome family protein
MNSTHIRTVVLLTAFFVSGIALTSGAAVAEEGCVTDKCHAKLLKGSTVHPVAETCDSCHESVETPHPKKGGTTFKLTQEPPALCQTCHEAFAKKVIHPPAQQGMCTTCHNPHSSNQPKLLMQPMKELCGTCHADHVDFKFLHGPVSAGDCTTCHAPHESNNEKLLVKSGQDLCFGCHVDMEETLKKKHVHPAMAGGCTSCHNPHGAAHKKLLAAEGKELCFTCHSDIADRVKSSTVEHAPLQTEDACVSCHSPHASDNEKLLLSPAKELCVTCHDAIISKNMTVLHGPNNDGNCARCHNPHGSTHTKLLVGEFPTEVYVPYTDKEYGLCFTCHKRDMVQYADTSFATNFRDGDRNLHYVHVNNKEKGRSCRLCHQFHGSIGPMLIADNVPFGKWNLPLRFVKTETGGGCSPGCHKPQNYDRKNPGRKPDAKKRGNEND